MAPDKSKTTSIRVDPEFFDLVNTIAEQHERSFSQQLVFMAKRYMAEHPEIMPEGHGKKVKRS